MADLRVTQKIDPILHEKMKNVVKRKGTHATLYDEYNLAIRNHIAKASEEEILKDSKIEEIISHEIKKVDKHLSSMLGRTGMDVSMTLMGLILFLEKTLKVDREQIQDRLMRDGARYFTAAIQDSKEK